MAKKEKATPAPERTITFKVELVVKPALHLELVKGETVYDPKGKCLITPYRVRRSAAQE